MIKYSKVVLDRLAQFLFTALALFCLLSCNQQSAPAIKNTMVGNITAERLLAINSEPGAWLTGGRDYQQSYYSPLVDINKSNIQQLGFAWQYEINTNQGFQATPIVVDGVMFTSGPKGNVYALDAKTGAHRWMFEPKIDPDFFRKANSGNPANRGVAVWEGRVYVGSLDGYLYALNADTGVVNWKVDTLTDRERGYTITGAPYIANKVIIVGNSGADSDARGYVTAYDLKTGEQRWRFFTVPGDPKKGFEHSELEMAVKTWDPNSLWEVGLGGTAWDGMAYDPELNLLYVGTGNGAPHPRKLRSPAGGDNLFLSSILAINPDNGKMVWYYQVTPADNWDYTATQKMILADLEIAGKKRKVIMQAPKNGFFYVLDRATGELLSAEPYVKVNWASHVDKKTGRPVETGQGEYFKEPKMIFPSFYGGHNWQPMSYNPGTGLVYIPAIERPAIFSMPDEPFEYKKGAYNQATQYALPLKEGIVTLGGDFGGNKDRLPSLEELADGQPDYIGRSFLRAWDPIKQKLVWEVETSGQWAGLHYAGWNGGGLMSTASGLVFQGLGDGNLTVRDATTGEQLHHIDIGTGITAAPMTYRIDGEQYVAVMAGVGGALASAPPGTAFYKYGNKGRIVAFKLGGGEVPHRPEIDHSESEFPMPPVARVGTPEQLVLGGRLFERNCSKCHANSAGGSIPDLSKMNVQAHREFLDIVLKGIREDKGMASFNDLLSKEEAESIHMYLIDLGWRAYNDHQQPVKFH